MAARWPNASRWLVLVLLVVHADLVAWIALRTSATIDEPGHLAAGLSIWELGRFDLYRVNPPLVKTVATMPVALAQPKTDWSNYLLGPQTRPEWRVGNSFIAANPQNWHWYMVLARWAVIPFSLVGGWVCYRWARELYGPAAGLLALALWCFSPNVLAFAATITADLSAATFGVLAAYAFWKWLKEPDWPRAFVAGVTLGLAELTKFTWVILFGLWPLLWLVWALSGGRRSTDAARSGNEGSPEIGSDATDATAPCRLRRQLPQLGAILLLGLYVVNLGYAFEGSFRPLEKYTFVSRILAGEDAAADGGAGGNRFAGTWIGKLPVPVPHNYLSGIDLQKVDFDRGRASYLNGQWNDRGWWYWYLYALLWKVPLGTGILLLMAAGLTVASGRYSAGWRNGLVLLAPAVAVFVLVSSETGFTRFLRYVLPCFPFVFIWIGKVARSVHLKQWLVAAGAAAALTWSVASSLWVYPHSMSYFNELAGGPRRGHYYLIDSNIDWGQDLWYLKEWYDAHPEARPLYVDVHCFIDIAHFGIEAQRPGIAYRPLTDSGDSSEDRARAVLTPGWYAISVHKLHDRSGKYAVFLHDYRPVAMAGYSIYIYHVAVADE